MEEHVIKGGPHNIVIVGEGWLKGVGLERKCVEAMSLILIVERCPRFDQEAGMA
jgi:hypothetical protein